MSVRFQETARHGVTVGHSRWGQGPDSEPAAAPRWRGGGSWPQQAARFGNKRSPTAHRGLESTSFGPLGPGPGSGPGAFVRLPSRVGVVLVSEDGACGPARGPWTNLGRLPLRVFSIGKYAFQKKEDGAGRMRGLACGSAGILFRSRKLVPNRVLIEYPQIARLQGTES